MTLAEAEKLVDFPNGKIIGARWQVIKKLGNGAYGAVYRVQSVTDPKTVGALKVESNGAQESILKLEVEVLKQLKNRPHTVQLIHSGKRDVYSYLVMTLCGPDLNQIKENNNIKTFSESTTYRISILCLYAIKQLHEVGYVHRDIKPSNFAIAPTSETPTDRHLIYLLDYGMVRQYAVSSNDSKWQIRPPRKRALLRGTLRYCSIKTHKRREQGRVDDLWSLFYMLIDLRMGGLPWSQSAREERILYLKETTSDKNLLIGSNIECYEKIFSHLRDLQYGDRPDYYGIYSTITTAMHAKNYLFSASYDWESTTKSSSSKKSCKTDSESDSRKKQCSQHSQQCVITERIPTAVKEAFIEAMNDVPDISNTSFKKSSIRATQAAKPSATDASDDELLP